MSLVLSNGEQIDLSWTELERCTFVCAATMSWTQTPKHREVWPKYRKFEVNISRLPSWTVGNSNLAPKRSWNDYKMDSFVQSLGLRT